MVNGTPLRRLIGLRRSNGLITSSRRRGLCSDKIDTRPVFNEANIEMISRRLQCQLFGRETEYFGKRLPDHLAASFKTHGIDMKGTESHDQKSQSEPVDFNLPPLDGVNIDEHFRSIAHKQSAEYIALADQLLTCSTPALPDHWIFREGWTKYNPDGTSLPVPCPEEDSIVFDVEVLMSEGPRPCIAVALTPTAWYSWISASLVRSVGDPSETETPTSCELNQLIPMYKDKEDSRDISKCIIGHFVSFDRARIRDEYCIEGTRARFLDTMALHMAVCGLTATQRSLKNHANKHRFKNKVWRDFMHERNRFSRMSSEFEEEVSQMDATEEEDDSMVSMTWLSESSLDNLIDVFRHHCRREPPQTKDPRKVFVRGNKSDVIANFQALVTYCANDVLMTHEVFKVVWPEFRKRFSHPVSLAGILEMSTAFLPVNEQWLRYQEKAEDTYRGIRQSQKEILMGLADRALEKAKDKKYQEDPWLWDLDWSTLKKTKVNAGYHHLPKWYRDAMKKPVKDNIDKGPVNLTLQTRVTPKLLRLSWNGLPLHHDSELRWGYLMPGRDPSAEKDPDFYDGMGNLRSVMEVENVGRGKEPKRQQMIFPYGAIVALWGRRLVSRLAALQSDLQQLKDDRNSTTSTVQSHDIRLLEELRSSCEALPMGDNEKKRIAETLRAVESLMAAEQEILSTKNEKVLTDKEMNQLICDLQVRGRDFWQDGRRYSGGSVLTKETRNPFIATCWFCHLPHKEGMGKAVGNPLSKPFLRFIAEGQLRSEYGDEADRLLRGQIHCSYWQGSSQRIREQICVWLHEENASLFNNVTGTQRVGLILPQVKVMGTVTRRAVEKTWLTASNAYKDRLGSELKAMVQSPPGYRFVGADVDSQELWIAATLGDAEVGVQGGTPMGWMVLRGSKREGTDLHTVTSSMIGITRDSAKVLNYARLYGAGQAYSAQLLQQFNPGLSPAEAKRLSRRLMEQTKGRRSGVGGWRRGWRGGTESETFNRLEEIARQARPRTPMLGAELTMALNPRVVGQDFMTSRVNWVVQSSAVDYLHCMLVAMRWLTERYQIPIRFSISIHDEVRYLVKESDADRAALALQITNLLTRALFVYKLGMRDLPQSVAFFSGVDIDRCLRKEPTDDCVTPSNEEGLHRNYGLPPGESLDIVEILRRTGGHLGPPPAGGQSKEEPEEQARYEGTG